MGEDRSQKCVPQLRGIRRPLEVRIDVRKEFELNSCPRIPGEICKQSDQTDVDLHLH
jgi:hypothetical protein